MNDIEKSLENPERLLYLGRSDDIVTLSDVSKYEYEENKVPEDEEILAPQADGNDPFLLPVKSDFKGTYSTRPSESNLVSFCSGIKANRIQVNDQYEYFAFLD
jgi:hypothetical protein